MNAPLQGTLTPVSRLRTALEETAVALATADLDRLLTAETALQAALYELPFMSAVDPSERPLFRRDLEGASAALLRCRRLGAGLSDFVRISLDAQGGQLGYQPARAVATALSGRSFTATV